MKTTLFQITGMRCDGCAETVRALLEHEPGVKAVDVSFATGQANRAVRGPDPPTGISGRRAAMIAPADSVLLPVGLGLLGFIEPCSLGATLVMVKVLEGQGAARQMAQLGLFAATRAGFIGLAGAMAAVLGTAFLGMQRAGWLLLGGVYVGLGLLFLAGQAGRLMVAAGPGLRRIGAARGSALLGVLLGLNIPACAAPLIFALLGTAAAGAGGGSAWDGFASLALFGLALSLPLVLAVLFAPGRRAIDLLAGYSARFPFWTGLVLVALGLWSIGFALFATIKA